MTMPSAARISIVIAALTGITSAAHAQLVFTFGQSSSRSLSSTSASVTTMDGVPGFIASTVTRPFVTCFMPIVGEYPQPFDAAGYLAYQDQQRRTAIEQSRQQRQERTLQMYLNRAAHAEREGNVRMVRANYRRAIGLAGEPLKSVLKQRLQESIGD